MITAGIDIGTRLTKIVIIDDGHLIASSCILSTYHPKEIHQALKKTIQSAGLKKGSIESTLSTGFGASSLKGYHSIRSSESSIVRAVHFLNPNARTIIDVGALFFRVVQLDHTHSCIDIHENEKCASGSGRFLEMVARMADLSIDQIRQMPVQSTSTFNMRHQCAVFAESEIITRLHAGDTITDIIFGVLVSIAKKIQTLIGRIENPEPEIVVCGGMATIPSWICIMENIIQMKTVRLPIDPILMSAFGAALLAGNFLK